MRSISAGDDAYRPSHGVSDDLFAERIALLLRQLLGVVEVWIVVVLGQDDGGGKHAAGQASAPGFVASGFDEMRIIGVLQHKLEREEGRGKREEGRINQRAANCEL